MKEELRQMDGAWQLKMIGIILLSVWEVKKLLAEKLNSLIIHHKANGYTNMFHSEYGFETEWVDENGYPYNVGSSIFGTATNSSGLSLQPFGFREGANGNFYSWGEQVIIWTDSDESQPRVEVFGNSAGVLTGLTDPYDGYYILLVKE